MLSCISGAGREPQGAGGERSEGGEGAARRNPNGEGALRRRPHAHVVRPPLREEPAGE